LRFFGSAICCRQIADLVSRGRGTFLTIYDSLEAAANSVLAIAATGIIPATLETLKGQ
jgi:hypothetical protein